MLNKEDGRRMWHFYAPDTAIAIVAIFIEDGLVVTSLMDKQAVCGLFNSLIIT